MKLRTLAGVSAAVLAFAATFMAGAWAQMQTERPIWKWPISMEAVNAAPKIHHMLFENDHVRLLEVTVQPGETEPLHGHMYPSVFAFDAVQASLKNHTLESGDTTNPRVYEDADWSQPQCRTMPVQAPHQVTDLDSFPVHFYRLEFKKMDGKNIETNWSQYKH
jgi:hypothetical protein